MDNVVAADAMATAMLDELKRLVAELEDRVDGQRYGEAMASLTALSPVRDFLAEYCGGRWAETAVPDDPQPTLTTGYL